MKQSLVNSSLITRQPSLRWQWLESLLQKLTVQPDPQVRRVRFEGRWQWQISEGDAVHYFDRDRDVVIWLESRYR